MTRSELVNTKSYVKLTDNNKKVILDLLKDYKSVLDIGCGSGYWLKELSKVVSSDVELKGIKLEKYLQDKEQLFDNIEIVSFYDFVEKYNTNVGSYLGLHIIIL